ALLPDAPMLLFYIQEKIQGVSEHVIWSELYYHPGWQALFNTFHSFPLLALACYAAWRARMRATAVFFASMFCHSLFDFPVHHSDAHQHFFPLSDYRFISPISYWDPAHYGLWVGSLELLIVVAGGGWLLRTGQSVMLSRSVSGLLCVYLLFWAFAAAMWLNN
ncbi:MAG: hypothetical protein R8K50_00670, partial [Mariprofundus sp.]